MKNFDYSTYLSPFTWRYGSKEMRYIWSEINKRKLWRKIWVELARAQYKYGLVSKKELDDLILYQDKIDIDKAHEIEKSIHHDLMAEIKVYASYAKKGGGKIHLGATSMDIEDNADILRIKQGLIIIEEKIKKVLRELSKKIKQYKDLPCMAFTHLQPAQPSTLGYRFCLYAQDLLMDIKLLNFVKNEFKGKGFKGAVGTSASYLALLSNSNKVTEMEEEIMKNLGIDVFEISSQVTPRKIEYFVSSFLSGVAQTLHKFAFDVRIMQSSGIFEWQEPFSEKQVGSSAMPFKKNPINSEKICSLATLVFNILGVSMHNASNMLLERTLNDSANRRIYLPEIFLAIDEMLQVSQKVLAGLLINQKQIKNNLYRFGPFSITETILMEAVKNGGDRQEIHERLRFLSMKAWYELEKNGENPLIGFILKDKLINKFIYKDKIENLLNIDRQVGLAPKKCHDFLSILKRI